MTMAILKNAPSPELIPTYEGSNQATHPSVLHFPQGWQGHPYWMAMTPYPFNNDGFEDPSLLVSDDGKRWEAPAGVTNPLVPAPKPGHNCDTELIYDAASQELRIYYVEADDLLQSWVKVLRSKDGTRWSSPEPLIHDPDKKYGILSPAIVRTGEEYRMWYVDTGNTGYVCQCNDVLTRTSSDGIIWSEAEKDPLHQPGWNIWHLNLLFERETGILHAMYPAYPDGGNCDDCALFYALRRPGEGWTIFSEPVLRPGPEGAWDDFCIYRSSMLLDREQDSLRVWYGGKKKADASWSIGYTEGSYKAFLRALEEGSEGK